MRIFKLFICWFSGHKWTCNAEKGIPPTQEQIHRADGFFDYAKMYCDRCGVESKLNSRL